MRKKCWCLQDRDATTNGTFFPYAGEWQQERELEVTRNKTVKKYTFLYLSLDLCVVFPWKKLWVTNHIKCLEWNVTMEIGDLNIVHWTKVCCFEEVLWTPAGEWSFGFVSCFGLVITGGAAGARCLRGTRLTLRPQTSDYVARPPGKLPMTRVNDRNNPNVTRESGGGLKERCNTRLHSIGFFTAPLLYSTH